jgi:hypothetical protein
MNRLIIIILLICTILGIVLSPWWIIITLNLGFAWLCFKKYKEDMDV